MQIKRFELIQIFDDFGTLLSETKVPVVADPEALARRASDVAPAPESPPRVSVDRGASLRAEQGAVNGQPAPPPPAPRPSAIPLVENDREVMEMMGGQFRGDPVQTEFIPRPVLGEDGQPVIRRQRSARGPRALDAEGAEGAEGAESPDVTRGHASDGLPPLGALGGGFTFPSGDDDDDSLDFGAMA